MKADRPDIRLSWPTRADVNWLADKGVSLAALARPNPVRVATGSRAVDGLLDESDDGARWFAFEQSEDVIFWNYAGGQLATFENRAFALGEDIIGEASTYAFDCALHIFTTPLEWLRASRDGIVVMDWSKAFDRLRDAPRIAIAEELLPLYRRHMEPVRMPELLVVPIRRQAA